MADPYPYTPIIRLPSARRADKSRDDPAAGQRTSEPLRYLVSDTLFVDELPMSVHESDIHALLQHCPPIEMKIHDADGFLRFSHTEFADRAYTVYNGFTFTNGAQLRLRMHSDPSSEPEACGDLLQIKNVPLHMDDNSIYDMFRPFGPLNLCKTILEGSQFRGMVYVQFFAQSDSDGARKNLHGLVLEGNPIAITSFVQPTSDHPQVAPSSKVNSSFVDYANLYVKNLDPSLSNDDLFFLFRKFGRIVSARVMSNPDNGLSKGYGFVSYAKQEEATAALCEMNNKIVHNKPLLVAYHEPKKSRSDRTRQTTTPVPERRPSGQSELYGQGGQLAQRRCRGNGANETTPVHGLGIEAIEPMAISPKMYLPQRKPSSSALDANLKLTPPYSSSPTSGASTGMSLVSLASGISVQPPPQSHTPTPQRQAKPTLRRRGSLESVSTVMTEMSANVQRQRMEDAVLQCGDYGSQLPDIVDMLLTLKRKERSLCLFNQDFLREKVTLALEALETFDDSGSEDEDVVAEAKVSSFISTQNQATSPPSSSARVSKAIPIVPPPEIEPKPTPNSDQERVEKLLASMKGQPIHEQKQLLGDCLFPLVKAVGTKQAPRVTIELLDTLDLTQLANEMHNKDMLKERVRVAFADIKNKSFHAM